MKKVRSLLYLTVIYLLIAGTTVVMSTLMRLRGCARTAAWLRSS